MEEIIHNFLETEISDQEYYDGIIDFIYSVNIRYGEYECNQFVVKKMDLFNFLIYEEYVIDNKREIHTAFSISKNKLIKVINSYAKKQGFTVKHFLC
ncbi:hypothetical protein MM221_13780 [Salipaludibacillus sp. LMS25]|jgi:hypothetical protein|uniref:hypothetical protein n=1 Tax=Salipaludibacillus sp. LMS25 TaxID=2924031 RepID=UPI0020D03628|nr:hypothetical protein [Salipaludibacillus sp. LMS25]UTR13684.1 hypothetical protein MM221_13780 [Salipaludibacillus sp. LMS25]